MKKLLLAVCAFCTFGMVNAKSIFEIKPAAATAGELVLEFTVENDGTCTGGQVNFYVPTGSSVSAFVAGDAMNDHKYSIQKENTAKWQKAGYDCYKLMVTSPSRSLLLTNNLGTATVTLPDSYADGFYTLLMSNNLTTTNGASTNRGNYASCSSFYTVGNVSEGTVALEGVLSTAVTEGIAALGVTSLDLTKVTGFEGTFTYNVGVAITAPTAAVKANVKVAATTAGDYMSLKSPVALPGVACYTYNKVAGDVAYFVEATDVPEGETVIVAGNVEKTVENATLVSVANGTANSGCYISNDGTELRRVNGTVKVPALRGTFDIPAGSNLRIALETPTGIKMIGTANEVFGNTYDLQGRQVENAHNGVYVVNGKKQFVK